MTQKSGKVTHTDYLHPRHLRLVNGEEILCVAPSHSQYSKWNVKTLPSWGSEK